ncbi:isochorismate synthase [Streptomyces sp. LNU-CPARS28]|uniref:isochorismate synthase n=1 Tax=Streptomyces sp. LNU-CPARS28 TaxID=3137371 RepID=UPI003136BC88
MSDHSTWPPTTPGRTTTRWLLSTPGRTLTAHDGMPLPTTPGPGQFTRLARTAARHLAGHPEGTIVAGLIPFDEDTPAHLCLARPGRWPRHTGHPTDSGNEPRHGTLTRPGLPHLPDAGPGVPEPPPDIYAALVEAARRATADGPLAKVVLARTLRIPVGAPPLDAAPALLSRLAAQDRRAHLFAATLPGHPGGAGPDVLIGATPETLLTRRGDTVVLHPLAGTAARHRHPGRDRAAARSLLGSAKDRHEHRIVVDALRARLAPLCSRLDVPPTPTLHATTRLWHLGTVIRARLHHPPPDALTLAALLHPTPAVCGTPTTYARSLIRRLEPVPRDYYTGLVGWMDRAGDGHWVIALRCGRLDATHLRLYAGAGIVAQSDPASELAETQAKFTTMLDALTATHDTARLSAESLR